ncbi:MAG: hypothetical protein ACI32N_05925 [Bulleidia sp.]
MPKKKKQLLYAVTLTAGLISFILQIFVFQKPDGTIGFILCDVSILMILISIIRLCAFSHAFRNGFLTFLDAITWIP